MRNAWINADYLDWTLSDFSGSIAADELYVGPFCVLSNVDNCTFKRLSYQVLAHDPPTATSRRSSAASKRPWRRAVWTLQGITTDGSPRGQARTVPWVRRAMTVNIAMSLP
jgi:hypothetical protein